MPGLERRINRPGPLFQSMSKQHLNIAPPLHLQHANSARSTDTVDTETSADTSDHDSGVPGPTPTGRACQILRASSQHAIYLTTRGFEVRE